MIYRTSEEKIDAYYANKDAVSQSELKMLLQGKASYLLNKEKLADKPENYFDEPADHFIIGSAIDCYITRGKEVFKQKYYISNIVRKPSDTMISILRYVFDAMRANFTEVPVVFPSILELRDLSLEAAAAHNYQPNYGPDAKIKAIVHPDNITYWDEMVASIGKQIITMEDFVIINSAVQSFKEEFPELFEETHNAYLAQHDIDIDIYFQVPVYATIRGIRVKGLMDLIKVDHNEQTVEIIDIKSTSEPLIKIGSVIRKFRLDIQLSFYDELITRTINNNGNIDMLDSTSLKTYVNSYSRHCGLIVKSTIYKEPATHFKLSEEFLNIGQNGRPELSVPAVYTIDVDSTSSTNITEFRINEILGFNQLLRKYEQIQGGNIRDIEYNEELNWYS